MAHDQEPARQKRVTRSQKLSVRFVGGYVDGWAMAVGECFKDALDILWTPVVIDGATRKVETEGLPPCYNFRRGDTFYDTPTAYQCEWGDALKKISRSVQVSEAQPDTPFEDGKKDGFVAVRVWHSDGEQLVSDGHVKMSQTEFVAFLQSGQLPDEAGIDGVAASSSGS